MTRPRTARHTIIAGRGKRRVTVETLGAEANSKILKNRKLTQMLVSMSQNSTANEDRISPQKPGHARGELRPVSTIALDAVAAAPQPTADDVARMLRHAGGQFPKPLWSKVL